MEITVKFAYNNMPVNNNLQNPERIHMKTNVKKIYLQQ